MFILVTFSHYRYEGRRKFYTSANFSAQSYEVSGQRKSDNFLWKTDFEADTGWSKNRYPALFLDNFGNSAPILTIFHCYKQKFMARKCEVIPPTSTLPSKTNTTANIGVKCFVLLTKIIYWQY